MTDGIRAETQRFLERSFWTWGHAQRTEAERRAGAVMTRTTDRDWHTLRVAFGGLLVASALLIGFTVLGATIAGTIPAAFGIVGVLAATGIGFLGGSIASEDEPAAIPLDQFEAMVPLMRLNPPDAAYARLLASGDVISSEEMSVLRGLADAYARAERILDDLPRVSIGVDAATVARRGSIEAACEEVARLALETESMLASAATVDLVTLRARTAGALVRLEQSLGPSDVR